MKTEIKKAIEVLRKASENHSYKNYIQVRLSEIEEKLNNPLSFEDWLEEQYDLLYQDSVKIEDVILYLSQYEKYLKSFNEDQDQEQEEKQVIEVKRTDLAFFQKNNWCQDIFLMRIIGEKDYINSFQIYIHTRKGLIAEDCYYQIWGIKEIESVIDTTTNIVYKFID